MTAFYSLASRIGLLSLLLCGGISLQAQDLCTGQSEPFTETSVTGRVTTYTIPAGFSGSVDLSISGGSGGRAAQPVLNVLGDVSSTCASNGGQGQVVKGRVRIDATTPGALRPGGLLRFIVGEGGSNEIQSAGFLVSSLIGGGGGGGSAVLYQAPGSATWDIVMVAGGGGGAYQATIASECIVSSTGGNAYLETNPANTGGGSSDIPGVGNAGGGGGATGKGDGTVCIDINLNTTNVYGGFPGGTSGGAGGTDEGCININDTPGGFGFGGGGASIIVGGGGGGYAGGDARVSDSGTGGGSFVSDLVSSVSVALNGNGSGGDGEASFAIVPDPAVARCQPDFEVMLSASGTAAITVADINNGSTAATCGSATPTIDVTSVDCSQTGTPVTVTLTIGAGATMSSCTTKVTPLDNMLPVVTCAEFTQTFSGCPDAIGPNTSDGLFFPISSLTNFSVASGGSFVQTVDLTGCVSDNCVGEGLFRTLVSSSEENRVPGVSVDIINVIGIRDASDNQAADNITFRSTIMFDGPAPTIICPANAVVDCGAPPMVSAMDASTESECGTPEITVSEPVITGEPNVAGTTYTFTYTATDGIDQASSCMQTITVQDTTRPVVMANDTVLYIDENGMASLSVADYEYAATDDCQDPTITNLFRLADAGAAAGAMEGTEAMSLDQVLSFTCDDIGNVNLQVQVEATDVSGNVGLDTILVTVLDTTRPALVCMDVIVFLDENGEASVTDTTLAITSLSDNCTDSAAIVIALVAPVLGCDGTTGTATLTATDVNANVATCMFTLTPSDTIPPTATCQDITVELDENGMGSIAAPDNTTSMLDDGSTDNCLSEGLTFSEDITEFTCENLAGNTVTLMVTDETGNISTCTSTVTVEDNLDPIVTITADPLMINLTDAEPEMTVTFGQFVTATDNCDDDLEFEADRPLTFGGADIGPGSFEVTVTDDSDNDVTVTINFVVTFDQPNLACRGAINLTLNDECQGLVIPSMVLTGNTSLIDFFMFDIVVQDEDPSNGPIIDGCGEFIYTISERTPEVAEPISGFTGPLAGDNWDTNADDAADWNATFTSSTLTLVTGPGGTGGRLMASYMFSDPGSLSFDYTYNNVDIGTNVQFDEAIVIVNFEGETVEVIENGATEPTDQPLTGSPTVDIQPGYSIVFGIDEDGFAPLGDAADLASELIVSNLSFAFAGSENPLALDFETCWGTVTAEDKTPPAIDTEIGDIELLCVDLDENRVDVLPNTVDRCYEVFSATGATVPNTMATALRNALSANTIGNGPAVVPTFTDGCTERLEVCVSETVTFDAEDPECNDVVITRTFTATEIAVCPSASGETNASTVASYVITFTRPSLDDLDGDNIEATAVYDRCTVNTSTSTTADIIADYPAPRSADFPFLFTEGGRRVDLVNGESVCGFAVSFADGNPTITCEYGYKFVRTYTVLDWCAPGDIRTFTQVVKVGDTEAPTFTGPTQDRDFDGVVDGDLIYTTNAGNSCAAYIILDGPGVGAVDNCSDEVTITATIFPGADLGATAIGAFVVDPTDGNAEVTSAIPVGTHLMRYTYTDDCGNTDFSDFIFTVEDGTAPVAICEDQLNVSISSGQAPGSSEPTGIAILTPEMIDAGSYDDCTGVTLLIALEGTDLDDYSDELILTCADLGTIQVSLRVEDENGNVNTCWLDVLVEDKNIPTCIPPGPMTITCIEYNESLPADISEATEEQLNAAFGSAVGIDNCEVMISSSVSGSVNSCGVGQLIRSFEAEDGEGFTDNDACMQSITIRGIFDYTITFPTDEESGCADIPAFDGLATEEFACDLITTDITIDTIAAVNAPEACFTLRVNYDVINYCEYNQLGECYRIPRDGDGIRNPETQLLYLNVIPNSTVNTEDDIAFLSRFTDRNYNAGAPQRDQLVDDGDDNDGTDDDNGNASEDSQAANGIGFAYAQDDSRGFFCYIQYVDVYDEDAPTIEGDTPEECFAGSSADCTAEVTLTFTADDECTTPVVTGELDANYIASAGFIPTRNLTSEEVSNDGVNYTVNLSDIPVGNHAIRIRANDGCGNFDVEVIEFCVEGDKAPTPICIQTLTVTLMPDGNGGGMAEIWASDFIASDVEDCFGNVIDKYSIYTEEEAGAAGFEPQAGDQGVFFDCDDLDAENVPVRVYAIADNGTADYCSVVVNVQAFQEGLCDDDGGNLAGTILTQHEETVEGVEVTLTGDNDMDMMATTAGNGSYTFTNVPAGDDYTVQPFHAAAVNLNEVTVGDVNLMGSVILGLADFATTYDYLAADVDGDRSLSVGDMVSVQRVILGLDTDFGAAGNWGFVPADVDVSNPYAEAFPGVYNVNDLVGNFFNADFVALELGNVNAANRSSASIEVEDAVLEAGQSHVIVLSGAELAGFQGTLELAAGLEVVDVTYEGEGGLNLNGAADGVITMMFLANATVNVEVRATEAGLLSELVALTSDVTVAEGVNLNGTAGPLSLNFTAATSTELVNVLHQNTPNPVVDVTTIRFELAQAGPAVLTLRDAAGRMLRQQKIDAIAGLNRVDLTDLQTGVITYTLTAGDFSATRKMVVVR